MSRRRLACSSSAIALLIALAWPGAAGAVPVTITTPYMNLENRGINSLGFSTGQFIRLGANSVTPNGNGGTTGIGTTIDPATGQSVTRTIFFQPSPVVPNFFQRLLSASTGLTQPWTLTFTNGADSAQAVVSLPAGTQQAPFVNSITLSGTSEHPTFGWTPPAGTTVNGYRINIYDKSLINLDPTKGPINTGNIVSRNFANSVTSYTVDPSDFNIPGYGFALDKNYSIEIALLQTKDGTGNSSNANLAAVSRVYADFTPKQGGGPVVNLPVVLQDGSYKFNMTVEAGVTYYIDPDVAIGYDYEIGQGDPNFRSVLLPTGIGDGLFDIWGFGPNDALMLLADDIAGGVVFDFGAAGVSRFRVDGIETSAGLDPANTTAFVTGLTFTGTGMFTGTQTPLTVQLAVPEPSAPGLVALALLGLAAARCRQASARGQYSGRTKRSFSSANRWWSRQAPSM